MTVTHHLSGSSIRRARPRPSPPPPVGPQAAFWATLSTVVGNRRCCECLHVDVRRVGALGACFDVSVDGAGIGTFTADELAARAKLDAALEDLRDGYGDNAR